jgi:hypothetical protein
MTAADRSTADGSRINADGVPGFGWLSRTVQGNPRPWRRMGPPGAVTGNRSLAVEIGWVQANRLYVVEVRPGGATFVRLDRARSPAPSWSALSWRETSIRSYAEVAAKATSTAQDTQRRTPPRTRRPCAEWCGR